MLRISQAVKSRVEPNPACTVLYDHLTPQRRRLSDTVSYGIVRRLSYRAAESPRRPVGRRVFVVQEYGKMQHVGSPSRDMVTGGLRYPPPTIAVYPSLLHQYRVHPRGLTRQNIVPQHYLQEFLSHDLVAKKKGGFCTDTGTDKPYVVWRLGRIREVWKNKHSNA